MSCMQNCYTESSNMKIPESRSLHVLGCDFGFRGSAHPGVGLSVKNYTDFGWALDTLRQ